MNFDKCFCFIKMCICIYVSFSCFFFAFFSSICLFCLIPISLFLYVLLYFISSSFFTRLFSDEKQKGCGFWWEGWWGESWRSWRRRTLIWICCIKNLFSIKWKIVLFENNTVCDFILLNTIWPTVSVSNLCWVQDFSIWLFRFSLWDLQNYFSPV